MTLPGGKEIWTELRRKADEVVASVPDTHKAELLEDLNRLIHEIQINHESLELKSADLAKGRGYGEEEQHRYEALYDKYANLFELSPNAYMVFDQTGIICEANLTSALMLNMSKRKLIGQPMARFIHSDDREAFLNLQQDCRSCSAPRMAELRMIQSGGRQFPAQIQLQYLPQINQAGNEFRAAIMDMSEQVRISADLHLLHQCLEIAVEAEDTQQLLDANVRQIKAYAKCSVVGIRLIDDTGHIPYQAHNASGRQFFERHESTSSTRYDACTCIEAIRAQCDPDKPYFSPFGSFYINSARRFLPSVQNEMANLVTNFCRDSGFESLVLIPISVNSNISGLIHVADRRENMFPLQVVEVLEQAAMRLGLALQRFHLQDKLCEAVDNLRELSSHLLKAKEDEQRRIAMELHDQTGQDLNVLKLRLKEIQKSLRKDQGRLNELCTRTQSFTDQIINNIRRMIHGLNPAVLDALGLVAALGQMVREFSEHGHMQIDARLEPLKTIGDRKTQVGLFRIVQEALSNAFKHADATRLIIDASHTDGGLCLVIQDNGKGFNPRQASRSKSGPKCMGLAAMKLRAQMIGAALIVHGEIGQGTKITVHIPKRNTLEAP